MAEITFTDEELAEFKQTFNQVSVFSRKLISRSLMLALLFFLSLKRFLLSSVLEVFFFDSSTLMEVAQSQQMSLRTFSSALEKSFLGF
jgi:hypothetical protein